MNQRTLGPEHLLRHLVVEEVLELAQCKGPITLERQGGEALDVLVVTVLMAVVMMSVVMTVPMAVAVIVPMAVIVLMVMAAVAMVVVAVAVIQARIVGGRTHLVGFEQSDTEQQGKRHLPFHRPQDPRIVLDGSELLFDALKPLL